MDEQLYQNLLHLVEMSVLSQEEFDAICAAIIFTVTKGMNHIDPKHYATLVAIENDDG